MDYGRGNDFLTDGGGGKGFLTDGGGVGQALWRTEKGPRRTLCKFAISICIFYGNISQNKQNMQVVKDSDSSHD